MTWLETLNVWGLGLAGLAIVFAFGAALGSFLNVVVYRLPRGLPIGASGSRCPKCANPISPRDNIPVLSWLLLKGRCRSCGQPISPRYPLVEATVGLVFLLVLFVELMSGGRNLPVRMPNRLWGPMYVWDTRPDLPLICLFHAALFYLLLALVLIDLDRRAIPRSIVVAGLVIGVLLPLAVPEVQVVKWQPEPHAVQGGYRVEPPPEPWPERIGQAALTSVGGLFAGVALGWLVSVGVPAYRRRGQEATPAEGSAATNPQVTEFAPESADVAQVAPPPRPERRRALVAAGEATIWTLALVGLFLGWQAAIAVAFLASIGNLPLVFAVRAGKARRFTFSATVFAAAIFQVFTWRFWEITRFVSGPGSALWIDAIYIAATAVLVFAATRLQRTASASQLPAAS
ncbi:MAG: prepilin peptidase [Planctomycetia bacterium]|nr:prepilin peptidase [Planctomycetia bacterium]